MDPYGGKVHFSHNLWMGLYKGETPPYFVNLVHVFSCVWFSLSLCALSSFPCKQSLYALTLHLMTKALDSGFSSSLSVLLPIQSQCEQQISPPPILKFSTSQPKCSSSPLVTTVAKASTRITLSQVLQSLQVAMMVSLVSCSRDLVPFSRRWKLPTKEVQSKQLSNGGFIKVESSWCYFAFNETILV